jgi:hypothetical protein
VLVMLLLLMLQVPCCLVCVRQPVRCSCCGGLLVLTQLRWWRRAHKPSARQTNANAWKVRPFGFAHVHMHDTRQCPCSVGTRPLLERWQAQRMRGIVPAVLPPLLTCLPPCTCCAVLSPAVCCLFPAEAGDEARAKKQKRDKKKEARRDKKDKKKRAGSSDEEEEEEEESEGEGRAGGRRRGERAAHHALQCGRSCGSCWLGRVCAHACCMPPFVLGAAAHLCPVQPVPLAQRAGKSQRALSHCCCVCILGLVCRCCW